MKLGKGNVGMPNNITCPNCGHQIDIENLIQAGTKDALNKEIEKMKAQQIALQEKFEKEKQ